MACPEQATASTARLLCSRRAILLRDWPVSGSAHEISKNLAPAASGNAARTGRDPALDFYSGVIYRALGIPVQMFTVLFAIGRLPGWIAHWREMHANPAKRINRPRQIYTGYNERDFVPIEKRG